MCIDNTFLYETSQFRQIVMILHYKCIMQLFLNNFAMKTTALCKEQPNEYIIGVCPLRVSVRTGHITAFWQELLRCLLIMPSFSVTSIVISDTSLKLDSLGYIDVAESIG